MQVALLILTVTLVLLIVASAVVQTRSRKRTDQAYAKLEASQRDLARLLRAAGDDIKKMECSQRALLLLLSSSGAGITASDGTTNVAKTEESNPK